MQGCDAYTHNKAYLLLGQFVAACKGSLRRLGMEQIGIGQLHWSTANYQPLQERALWDGLVALYNEVHHLELMSVMKLAGLFSTRMFTVPEGAKQKQ